MAVKARAGSVRNKAATASAVKRVSCFGVTTLQLLFIIMLAMDQSSSLDLDQIPAIHDYTHSYRGTERRPASASLTGEERSFD
jgi:hypothetical protein